jgi:hypothetical protein
MFGFLWRMCFWMGCGAAIVTAFTVPVLTGPPPIILKAYWIFSGVGLAHGLFQIVIRGQNPNQFYRHR